MTEATKLELTPDLPDTLDASDYTVEQRDPRSLQPHPQNYRHHPEEQIAEIARNIRDLGLYRPVIVREDGTILAGHGITLACIELGMATIPVYVFGGTEAQARRLLVADNELSRMAEDDGQALAALLAEVSQDYGDLRGTGWDDEALKGLLAEVAQEVPAGNVGTGGGQLAERFGVPPFSVLDARQGYWQERKRAWLALGIQSELGRGGQLLMQAEQVTEPGLNYYRNRNKQAGGGRQVNVAIGGSPMPLDRAKKASP